MKLSKSKLKQIIMEVLQEEDAYEIGAPDEAVVVDMTGREYSAEELRAALGDEEISLLMRAPERYFVKIKDGRPVGVGPEE